MSPQQGAEAPVFESEVSIDFFFPSRKQVIIWGQMFKSCIYPQIIFSARIQFSLCAHICVAAFLSMIANTKSHAGLWQDVASRKTKEEVCLPNKIPVRLSGIG